MQGAIQLDFSWTVQCEASSTKNYNYIFSRLILNSELNQHTIRGHGLEGGVEGLALVGVGDGVGRRSQSEP